MSTYNLIETLKDDTPIIDTKGQISGYMSYRVNIDILDEDMETVMNALDFETLAECVGKYLRVTVELKRAQGIQEKYSYKTKAQYNFLDEDLSITKIVEKKKDPEFAYKASHIVLVTDELNSKLKYNALTIGVYGMIESKRTDILKKQAA
jgi:Arc/MetJ family transcription regulator